MLRDFLYEENSFGVFLLVTVVLGGGAAWLAGRAVALMWSRAWLVVLYVLLIGAAVRFIHFALFGGTFLSPHYYAVDTVIALAFGTLGFRITRAHQMARQYGFRSREDRGSWA
jgi:Domain of unknown function (DUF6867)